MQLQRFSLGNSYLPAYTTRSETALWEIFRIDLADHQRHFVRTHALWAFSKSPNQGRVEALLMQNRNVHASATLHWLAHT
jgi:hypothetical protein